MRFLNYISESGSMEALPVNSAQEVANLLLQKCHKYFQEIYPGRLYRGMDAQGKMFGFGMPRLDRRPKDTPQKLHEMADEWFLKKFGWRCRSQGLFVSTKEFVGLYGDKYVIFPAGDYSYVFSPQIHDLMNDLDNAVLQHTSEKGSVKDNFDSLWSEQYPALQKSVYETLDEAGFTDKGLREYMFSKGNDRTAASRRDREVMFRCPQGFYYVKFDTELDNALQAEFKKRG